MKKIIVSLFLILCSAMCLACSCGKSATISYAHNKITINMGDTFVVNDEDIKIFNSESLDYEMSIIDTTIAQINGNVITPMQKGNTVLKIELASGEYCEVPLVITHIIYANSASIEKSYVQINMHESVMSDNIITLNEGCNEVPQVTYDESIIDFNYETGKIIAKKEGSTTVVVLFGSCNVSFNVNVVNIVYTRSFEIEDISIYEKTSGRFEYIVFPEIANTYEFVCESDILTVDAKGNYIASGNGVAEVIVKYLTGKDLDYSYKTINVVVLKNSGDFDLEITNIDGTEITECFSHKEYLMTISNVGGLREDMLVTDSNIEVVDKSVINDKIIVVFKFVESGEIDYQLRLDLGINLFLAKTISQHVIAIEDLEISAVWFVYKQEVFPDGKYHIFLGGDNAIADSLIFQIEYNNEQIFDDFSIYMVNETERIECYNSIDDYSKKYTFSPTELGEYTLEFEINGVVIESCVVVVDNYV